MSKLDVVEIWKELHRMPEPGMNEFKTGAYLADTLEKLGYEVTRGVGKTGVVGVVRGKEPGPVVMLRADMDALPFKNEDGSIEYVHACGHDSHSAMVLTAAAELVDKVKKGTLKILFQPAEETLEGALAVMKDGAIDDVDIALGLHVRPVQDIPAARAAPRCGIRQAHSSAWKSKASRLTRRVPIWASTARKPQR